MKDDLLERLENAAQMHWPHAGLSPLLREAHAALQSQQAAPAEVSEEDYSDVDALLIAGKLIEALKLYRNKAGCSLREAKDHCDKRQRIMRESGK